MYLLCFLWAPCAVDRLQREDAIRTARKVEHSEQDTVDTLPVEAKGVYQGAVSANGRWLAVAATDKRVRIWNTL